MFCEEKVEGQFDIQLQLLRFNLFMKYEQKAPKDRPIIISYLSPSLSLSQNHDNSYILSHIYFYEFSITSDGGCWKKESMK